MLLFTGIITGVSADKFAPTDTLTRGQMAAILTRALELADASDLETPFGDIAGFYENYIKAIYQAELTQGVSATQYGTDRPVLREQFATFLYRDAGVKQIVEQRIAGDLVVQSVAASNSTTVVAKFNKALSADAVVELQREGGAVVNVSEKVFTEDRKEVSLELPNKFVGGDYVLVVKEGEEEVSYKFELADERVEEITIPSDVAIVNNNTSRTSATIAYQVKNQYGENITDDVNVTATTSVGSVTSAANGVLTIGNTNGFTLESNVTVSLLNANSGKFVSKTVKVSSQALVSSFDVKGLHHATLGAPRAGESTNGYSLLIQAKDQYGNALNATQLGQPGTTFVASNTNTNIATLNFAGATDVRVDGVDYISVPLTSSVTFSQGTTNFNFISATSGQSASYKLEVPAALAVQKLTLGAPTMAVAGETFRIPFTALDQEGNEVTNVNTLNAVNFSIANAPTGLANNNVNFVRDFTDNKVYLEVNTSGVDNANALAQDRNITIIATTGTEVVQRAVNLRANAHAASVSGIKNIESNIIAGDSIPLTANNLTFRDQYGRTMSTNPTIGDAPGNYQVKVTSNNANVTVSNDTLDGNNNTVTLGAGATKGASNITISLLKVDTDGDAQPVSNSSYRYTSQVIEASDVTSLEFGSVSVLNDGVTAEGTAGFADYELKVYGVDTNGNRALIPANAVTFTSNGQVATYDPANRKIAVASAPSYAGTAKVADVNFIVSAYGNTKTGELKVSKEAPVLTDLVIPSNLANRINATTVSVPHTNRANLDAIVADLAQRDQYGASMQVGLTQNTGSNFRKANGDRVTSVADVDAGGSFEITVLKPNGGTFTLKASSSIIK
ncbi:S-layer homology domain-containing protein [Evansella sp. AB-rgal1]|uniref:S-layer homology domain-containing protein n=1 Tax=Evansella sp. AB-rgal1 TaxID=3242696 RepID=UPI00359D7C81